MVFVTVGTHEQQFDRIIKKIDSLKKDNIIKDDVFIQIGYSNYVPKYCKYKRFISYEEMNKKIDEAKIIITHGGPSSFIPIIQKGKIPIVVPRNVEFQEHVNNHQVDFIRYLEEHGINIIPIYNIDDIDNVMVNYKIVASKMKKSFCNHNDEFCRLLEENISLLFR